MENEKLRLNISKTNYVIYSSLNNKLGKTIRTKVAGPFTVKENAIKELEALRANSPNLCYTLMSYQVKESKVNI